MILSRITLLLPVTSRVLRLTLSVNVIFFNLEQSLRLIFSSLVLPTLLTLTSLDQPSKINVLNDGVTLAYGLKSIVLVPVLNELWVTVAAVAGWVAPNKVRLLQPLRFNVSRLGIK